MVTIYIRRTVLLILVWMLPAVASAGVTASFDRNAIHINETVRLVIESDGSGGESPDLSAVEQHFNILGQTTSQKVSIVNGQRSTTIRYIIELKPRQEGSFSIDPIAVGSESTPIMRITVLPEPVVRGQTPDIFIETEVDHDTVYVQQQLLLTVRLFLASRLLAGKLEDPEPASIRIERLGEAKRYQSSRAGRDYLVYERNYALFPQQSGELEIPPIRFEGRAEQQRSTGLQLHPGQPVQARSDAVKISVKPPNPQFTGSTWLPVSQLQIDEVGDIKERGEAGQPLTRKIQVQAKGLTAEQLPEIQFGNVDGVRVYPDKPVGDTALADGELVAVQQNDVAVIVSKPGTTTFPAIEIDWWNTVTDKPEKAVLPARTVEILPSAVSTTPRVRPAGEAPTRQKSAAESAREDIVEKPQNPVAPMAGNDPVWKLIALGAMALWLLTLVIALVAWRRSRWVNNAASDRSTGNNPASGWRGELKKACRNNDARAARRALAGWASTLDRKGSSLEAWMTTLDNPDLANTLRDLDQHLYASGGKPEQWCGEGLWKAFRKGSLPVTGKQVSSRGLQPLYPQSMGN